MVVTANSHLYSCIAMSKMIARGSISSDIPTIASGATVARALELMDECHLSQLPVVVGDSYVGLVCERELLSQRGDCGVIGDALLHAPFVFAESSIFEALSAISQENIWVLPVLDQSKCYLGAIDCKSLVSTLSQLCSAVSHEGALVWADMAVEEYSASLLARLAEECDSTLVSLLTFPNNSTGRLEVCVRLSIVDATPFVRALERYDIHVVRSFQQEGVFDDNLRNRVDELLYYLEM